MSYNPPKQYASSIHRAVATAMKGFKDNKGSQHIGAPVNSGPVIDARVLTFDEINRWNKEQEKNRHQNDFNKIQSTGVLKPEITIDHYVNLSPRGKELLVEKGKEYLTHKIRLADEKLKEVNDQKFQKENEIASSNFDSHPSYSVVNSRLNQNQSQRPEPKWVTPIRV